MTVMYAGTGGRQYLLLMFIVKGEEWGTEFEGRELNKTEERTECPDLGLVKISWKSHS